MATYSIDTTHSEIGFTVRHMMFAKVRGQFKKWKATVSYNPTDPTKSKIQVDIDAGSIDTREAQRDAHLRSGDFFDADKFPSITFTGRRIEPAGQGHYVLVGELAMHGVTREVMLDVAALGGGKDPWGKERLGFSARGVINRGDWDLKWNQVLEAGSVLVSDKVEIEVEVQVVVDTVAASATVQ